MSDNVNVSIRNLYKVFGADPQAALTNVLEGMSKAELLNLNGHGLGLRDINRARVLRVRSIMTPLDGKPVPPDAQGEVGYDDTLESMIARSGGDTSHRYIVMRDGQPAGTLDMTNLVKALVPRVASEAGARRT